MSCRTAAAACPLAWAASARTAALQTVSVVDRAAPHAKNGLSFSRSHWRHTSPRALVQTRKKPANRPRSLSDPFFFGMSGAATSLTCGGTKDAVSQASHRIAATSLPSLQRCPRCLG